MPTLNNLISWLLWNLIHVLTPWEDIDSLRRSNQKKCDLRDGSCKVNAAQLLSQIFKLWIGLLWVKALLYSANYVVLSGSHASLYFQASYFIIITIDSSFFFLFSICSSKTNYEVLTSYMLQIIFTCWVSFELIISLVDFAVILNKSKFQMISPPRKPEVVMTRMPINNIGNILYKYSLIYNSFIWRVGKKYKNKIISITIKLD